MSIQSLNVKEGGNLTVSKSSIQNQVMQTRRLTICGILTRSLYCLHPFLVENYAIIFVGDCLKANETTIGGALSGLNLVTAQSGEREVK